MTRNRLITMGTLLVAAALFGCSDQQEKTTSSSVASVNCTLQDRIARSIIAASPVADPADPAARDRASAKLAECSELLTAAGEEMLWGGFDAKKGYDPAAYRLTWFSPLVWSKMYLSTYMFPGPYEVRKEGHLTVLEVAAKFRNSLDAGDYPYPFWHSQQKWQSYCDTAAVLFIFEGDRLIAAYRKAAPPDPANPPVARKWDGQWQWTDANGQAEPRVSLYSYILSPDNPYRGGLETAYRSLEANFRGQSCMSCHAPDNAALASELTLLNFPNQALTARHSLVAVLKGNKMPPADGPGGPPAGIADDAVRQKLISLAEAFEKEADAAIAFEAEKKKQHRAQ